jgi:hypothetical protein|nr:MAG TPA: Protein of unknown function (DUF1642) [Caudoviricetes sp.]
MSEEKLYAVKNNEGKYWDFSDNDIFWSLPATRCPTTSGRSLATSTANKHGGHVVTFVEEPKKVVVSAEEAEMLKRAKDTTIWRPASVIAGYACEAERDSSDAEVLLEDRLMRAYVNGYTVENEKKYNVKVPHTREVWYYKSGDADLLTICPADKKLRGKFTESEIKYYGLQDCEKEEVTDDER